MNDDNGWMIHKPCYGFKPEPMFFGSHALSHGVHNDLCGINITSAEQHDTGNWTCVLKQCKNNLPDGCNDQNENGINDEATIRVQVTTQTSKNI